MHVETEAAGARPRFTDASGLARSRYGTFMQKDPIGFEGGMNLYGYVGGDPVNLTDPLGLCASDAVPMRKYYSNLPPSEPGTVTAQYEYICVPLGQSGGNGSQGSGGGGGGVPGRTPIPNPPNTDPHPDERKMVAGIHSRPLLGDTLFRRVSNPTRTIQITRRSSIPQAETSSIPTTLLQGVILR